MPHVTIEWWEGRSPEQKEKLITGITKVFSDLGIEAEGVQIIIYDVPRTNWGLTGKQASKV